jgi:hypothetical protein
VVALIQRLVAGIAAVAITGAILAGGGFFYERQHPVARVARSGIIYVKTYKKGPCHAAYEKPGDESIPWEDYCPKYRPIVDIIVPLQSQH